MEPGSAGSSSARRDKHSAGARRRREEPFAVTLQFECLHGAMMLEAAGGISSHTHTYFWILASLLHRQGYMLLSCSAPHLHEHEKHLLSSQTTTTTTKKAEHVCHSRRDPLQRAIILCCFVCFFFVFFSSVCLRPERDGCEPTFAVFAIFETNIAFSPNAGDLGVFSLL